MTLLDHLGLADPAALALASGPTRLTFGDAIEAAQVARQGLRADGARVFLNLSDAATALVALAALDGVAEAVILSSPALDAETLAALASAASADVILTDRKDVSSDIPVVADLAAIDLPPREHLGPTSWVMTTSGTTGQPKLVVHSFDSLTRTTKRDQSRGRGQVWGLLYDYTRFAGLQVVLQTLLSGASLIVPLADLPLDERIAILGREGVTHLSATPTLWRKILMTPGAEALPLRQVTLGGEIADDAVLSALIRRYADARVTHIFASTEAGVGFSVTDGRAGFPETYLQTPPLGIDLKVEDDQLLVRNPLVAPEYLGGRGELARDGWVNTGDQVRVEAGRVLFMGRSNGVINVGGDKVHPEEVEATILSHPQVEMAQVYAKKNPIVGALVAADIQPVAGLADAAALRNELKTWLAERLERHKVPAFIRMVEKFETNAAGKLKRGN